MPVGWVVSPLVLFGLNRTMKEKDGKKPNIFKRWALIGIVGAPLCLTASSFLVEGDFQRKVNRCNNGKDERCEVLLENYSSRLNINKEDRDKVTNPVAIPFLEKVIEGEFNPRNGKSEYGLGVIYSYLEDTENACKFFTKAMALNYKPAFYDHSKVCIN